MNLDELRKRLTETDEEVVFNARVNEVGFEVAWDELPFEAHIFNGYPREDDRAICGCPSVMAKLIIESSEGKDGIFMYGGEPDEVPVPICKYCLEAEETERGRNA